MAQVTGRKKGVKGAGGTAFCLAAAGIGAAFVLGLLGCAQKGNGETQPGATTANEALRDEITIMHVDAGSLEFQAFIQDAQEELQMKIHVLPYPANADSRHAKVSSLLAAGDPLVDVFAVNDEMISEFKYAGYLEPLQEDVMNPKTAAAFPQEYLEQTVMVDGQIFSAPYMMEVLALWINEAWLKEAGVADVRTEENFISFLTHEWGKDRYAYGGAWEKTYVYNEIGEWINLLEGDYFDWENEKTREAAAFLKQCVELGYTPKEQLIDQYEQMNQKFIDGRYGMVFMYTGAMNTYVDAGVYGEDQIHLTPLPDFGGNTTYIATWQYALNKASQKKEAAKRFMSFAVSKEGSRLYAERMNRMPAREDLIREENLEITGFEQMRDYLKKVRLKARPIPENSMDYISRTGELFQKYVTGELKEDDYFLQMQRLVDANMQKMREAFP